MPEAVRDDLRTVKDTPEEELTEVQKNLSVHDYHATLLHLLGMNFRDLIYDRHGLGERLTDQFAARVIKEILA